MKKNIIYAGVTISIAAAAYGGTVYQTYKTVDDLGKFEPLGKIYYVDGGKHHINCLGRGKPTVILEAGLGESSLSWYLVQKQVAKITKVCSYDRPGLGWSEAAKKSLTLKQVSTHLHHLLQAANIESPYILVGHSRGGIYVRNYYHNYMNEVAGMVLVDSTHEQGPARLYPYDTFGYHKQKFQTLIAVPLSKLGIIRLFGWANVDRHSTPLPENIIAAKSAVQNRTDTARAVVNEILVMRQGLKTNTKPPRNLGELPLVVISAGENLWHASSKAANMESDDHSDNAIRIKQIKADMQSELAALSENSTHIIAEKSGHFVIYDQPKLIIQSITEMVHALR